MHIGTIARNTEDWPVWTVGPDIRQTVWSPPFFHGEPCWTLINGILYELEWTFAGPISVKSFTNGGTVWKPQTLHWKEYHEESEKKALELMRLLPSYLVRWQLS